MTFSVYVRILMIVQATQLLLVFISLCHIYSCTYVWGDWGGGYENLAFLKDILVTGKIKKEFSAFQVFT